MSSPVVVIVAGPPCSGKSTLASQIASRLGLPLLEKDTIKEALFDSVGVGDREWSRRLSQVSFEMLLGLADRVVAEAYSIVLEGNFGELQAPALEALRAGHGAVLVQVRCGGSPAVLLERMQVRAERPLRHPGHLDTALLDEARVSPPPGWSEALPIDSIELQFDSTAADATLLEQLLQRIGSLLGDASPPGQRVSTSSTSD